MKPEYFFQNLYYQSFDSPIGQMKITASSKCLLALDFCKKEEEVTEKTNQVTKETVHQLMAYFEKKLRKFELPLKPLGTPFQQSVWNALLAVPFGKTTDYLNIARQIGNKKAVRAVGAANGQNPISIIIPCHRIIGSNGKLVGYGGGLWRKEWLLRHEGALLQGVLMFQEPNGQ